MRRWTLAVLVGLSLFGGFQSESSAATAFTGSFVDVDNDGIYGARDIPLSTFLGAGSYGFNASTVQPGWRPQTGPVGLVIQGTTTFTQWYLDFQVTGDIRIRGTLASKAVDAVIAFRTLNGNIYIEPKASLTGSGQLELSAVKGNLRIGAGAKLTNKGSMADLDLDAGNELYVETGAVLSAQGNDYPTVSLWGNEKLTIEPKVTFSGPAHATIALTSLNDVTLDKVSITSGYVRIEAYADATHPAAKRVYIKNSTISQTYKNGDFRILARPDVRNLRYAPDAIVLEKTSLKLKTGTGPLYMPEPVVR